MSLGSNRLGWGKYSMERGKWTKAEKNEYMAMRRPILLWKMLHLTPSYGRIGALRRDSVINRRDGRAV